jgi:hypothetical protein
VKRTLLSEQSQSSKFFLRPLAPEHLPVKARIAHLFEVSADLLGVNSAALLGVPVGPKSLLCTGEAFLKVFAGHSKSSTVDTDAESSGEYSQNT